MISKSNTGIDSAAVRAVETQEKAEMGKDSVGQMLNSIEKIKTSNDTIMEEIELSNQRFGEIVSIIRLIGDRTKVINEIVFQTKLLSFNASVEAVRAGENGRGFAVVAEEVGNLARMSGAAAAEITHLLSESTNKVDEIIKETTHRIGSLVEDSRMRVIEGVQVAGQCSESLEDIVENVKQVNQLFSDIAQNSKEQAQGVNEITEALTQMNNLTQQNSAASQTVADAAEKLFGQAENLNEVVLNLTQIMNGQSASEKAPRGSLHYLNDLESGNLEERTLSSRSAFKVKAS